jgi:hypothetical protein
MSTLHKRLQARGFQRITLGGDCTGWATELEHGATIARKGRYFCGFRGNGMATLVITAAEEPVAPESLTESVAVVAYSGFGLAGERVIFEDTFPSLTYALRCIRR